MGRLYRLPHNPTGGRVGDYFCISMETKKRRWWKDILHVTVAAPETLSQPVFSRLEGRKPELAMNVNSSCTVHRWAEHEKWEEVRKTLGYRERTEQCPNVAKPDDRLFSFTDSRWALRNATRSPTRLEIKQNLLGISSETERPSRWAERDRSGKRF